MVQMRPAFAVQVKREWIDKSERETGVARRALLTEFGDGWVADDPELGEMSVLDGTRGRGAANCIPVIEWLGDRAGGGLVALAVSKAAPETSYTGIEPWIVSLVNESRTTRYLLTVDPQGDAQGCLATPMGKFEAMYSPLTSAV
jgi:hypothetical protein